MIQTNDITRPPREWVEALQHIGAATASSTLNKMGIRNTHICGPTARTAGRGDRRPGAHPAVHAEARGPLRRG